MSTDVETGSATIFVWTGCRGWRNSLTSYGRAFYYTCDRGLYNSKRL